MQHNGLSVRDLIALLQQVEDQDLPLLFGDAIHERPIGVSVETVLNDKQIPETVVFID